MAGFSFRLRLLQNVSCTRQVHGIIDPAAFRHCNRDVPACIQHISFRCLCLMNPVLPVWKSIRGCCGMTCLIRDQRHYGAPRSIPDAVYQNLFFRDIDDFKLRTGKRCIALRRVSRFFRRRHIALRVIFRHFDAAADHLLKNRAAVGSGSV